MNDRKASHDHISEPATAIFRNSKSGRYKLEKKRKQVQRAESERIKDVVLGQIEAEKELFSN